MATAIVLPSASPSRLLSKLLTSFELPLQRPFLFRGHTTSRLSSARSGIKALRFEMMQSDATAKLLSGVAKNSKAANAVRVFPRGRGAFPPRPPA